MTIDEKRLTIRLPGDLHTRLLAAAERNRRSLNAEMLVHIERGLALDEVTPWPDETDEIYRRAISRRKSKITKGQEE